MQNILQDIRYGARMLWKNRLATVVCATALALGIGANTAMFSVAEAFLLHSVPFEKPDRILAMVYVRPQENIDRIRSRRRLIWIGRRKRSPSNKWALMSGMKSISRAIASRKKCRLLR